jgi:hypothetical protein
MFASMNSTGHGADVLILLKVILAATKSSIANPRDLNAVL